MHIAKHEFEAAYTAFYVEITISGVKASSLPVRPVSFNNVLQVHKVCMALLTRALANFFWLILSSSECISFVYLDQGCSMTDQY